MKKKRVLIISNYFWTIEKFRKNLILDLRKNDFEVSICAMFDGYEKQFSEDGFAVIDLNIDLNGKNPINEFKTLRDIFSLLKNGKFDFVYTFSIKPNIYTSVCAQLFNSTHVATVTGLGTLYYSKTLTILMTVLYYACVSHRTKIIVQNDDDKKIVQSITRSSVSVEKINGSGVDLKEFKYTKPTNEDVTYFLYVGRLIRDKGVHHYLEVAEKLKRKYGKEVEFHLVGPLGVKNSSAIKGSELDYYIRGNYVTYHGYQHDIRKFLKKSHCLVLPSIREGTSKIILEAGAIGRPTICFDVPGCNNIISNGVNGFMTKNFNSDGLCEAVENFLKLSHFDRSQIGKNARHIVKDRFCVTKINERYVSLVGGVT